MNTYKFRGKDESGTWIYGGVNDAKTAIVRGFVLTAVFPETIGQFTRTHDCTGQEIYEDDFLVIDGECSRVYQDKGGWILGNPKLVEAYGLYDCSLNEVDLSKAKVIGNAHDNPELAEDLP